MCKKKKKTEHNTKQNEGKKAPPHFFSFACRNAGMAYTSDSNEVLHVAESPKTQYCRRPIGSLPAAEHRAGPSLRPCFPKPGRALKFHAAVCLGGTRSPGEVLASLRGGDRAVSGLQPGPHPREQRGRSRGGKGRRDVTRRSFVSLSFQGQKNI